MKEELEKLKDRIKDIKVAMLTTIESNGELHSRPMATSQVQDDGTIWFFTSDESGKVEDLSHDKQVSLSYQDTMNSNYVNVSGTASVSHNKEKMKELWKPFLATWYPKGIDNPNIALLKIEPHKAEFWDEEGGRMVSLF